MNYLLVFLAAFTATILANMLMNLLGKAVEDKPESPVTNIVKPLVTKSEGGEEVIMSDYNDWLYHKEDKE